MEKGAKIGIAALIIAAVTVPTIAYAFGKYLLPSVGLESPLSFKVGLTGYQHAAGEVMNVSFTLTNIARRPLLLIFPDTQTFDFSVRNATGEIVYVWSWGKGFAQMIVEAHLAPWQSIQMTLRWTPETPGIYMLTGYTVTFWLGSWEDNERYNLTAQPIPLEVIS